MGVRPEHPWGDLNRIYRWYTGEGKHGYFVFAGFSTEQ